MFFDKPAPVTIKKIIDPVTKGPAVLTFEECLDSMVWPLPMWRASKDHIEAARALRRAIAAAEDGHPVECSVGEKDRLVQAFQSLDLSKGPLLADAVGEFQYAVMCTREKAKPES